VKTKKQGLSEGLDNTEGEKHKDRHSRGFPKHLLLLRSFGLGNVKKSTHHADGLSSITFNLVHQKVYMTPWAVFSSYSLLASLSLSAEQ
jgi:hypothetical protein